MQIADTRSLFMNQGAVNWEPHIASDVLNYLSLKKKKTMKEQTLVNNLAY